jgi:hypothetical protein
MAEIATKPKPVAKPPATRQCTLPAIQLAGVVDRSAELSDEVPGSLGAG